MSPEKTHPDGWYRLDRQIHGVGRIRVKSARTLALHRRVDALVTKYLELGRLEELRLLRRGEVTALMLVDADRRNATVRDPSARLLAVSLWDTVHSLLTGTEGTTVRYRTSFKALRESGVLSGEAVVADLAGLDWTELEQDWKASPADWNHLQRAVSRLLTLHLGEHHPFRVQLMKQIPKRMEVERLVELTPAEFQAIIAPAPLALQHCFWTLAATGLRSLAEYRKLTREAIGKYVVHVRLSKNTTSHRTIPVDPRLWPHVSAAIPCPVKPDYLTRAWRTLADAAGRSDLVLRDLRHCYGFWSLEAGVPINVVRDAMGHRSLSTTQRYVKQRAKREHAEALAGLLVPQVTTHLTKGRKRA